MSNRRQRSRPGVARGRPAFGKRQVMQSLVGAAVVLTVVSTLLWGLHNRNDAPGGSATVASHVQAVTLEDSRTGQPLDLGQYLGKKDIVLVAYMGYF